MATATEQVLADLEAEHADLDALVAGLDEGGWATPTPAEGWDVRDQVGHLAYFDDASVLAVRYPGGFGVMAEAATESFRTGEDPMAEHLARGRALLGRDVLGWWRSSRGAMLAALRACEPERRIEWFGPPMGVRSFATARLMETWAHAQDVADALGVVREPTARLRNIAHLGVLARPYAFVVRGLEVPAEPVTVVLEAPDGGTWSWGEGAEGADEVRGPALDFCLVVVQRRNLADTALEVTGEGARQWMAIAQAYAGAPGSGREPLGGGSGAS